MPARVDTGRCSSTSLCQRMSAQCGSGSHSALRSSVACREPFDTQPTTSWTPSLCTRRCDTRRLVVTGPTLATDTEVNAVLSGRLRKGRAVIESYQKRLPGRRSPARQPPSNAARGALSDHPLIKAEQIARISAVAGWLGVLIIA